MSDIAKPPASDLDCFAAYSRHHGHAQGDEVLRRVAPLLAESAAQLALAKSRGRNPSCGIELEQP